jgi:long-chain acyl-CoA synthetase
LDDFLLLKTTTTRMKKFPWYAHYPQDVPQQIDSAQYESLAELLHHSFENFGSRPAFENMGKIMTFSELKKASDNFSAYLVHDLGLVRGDKVAIQLPNLLQYPVVLFGALRAGMTVVNVNPLYTSSELKHQLNDADAKVIIVLANFAGILEGILSETKLKHVLVTQIGDMIGGIKGSLINFAVKYVKKMVPPFSLPNAISLMTALKSGADHEFIQPHIESNDLAFLQYTGGTTGVSKGAMLSHGNLVANLLQVNAWMKSGGLKEGAEIYITALPIYHIFALVANVLGSVSLGSQNILITNPRDMDGFIKELKKHKFTILSGVNTLFNGLLNHPEFKNCDFSKLRFGFGGGMAVQNSVAEKWLEVTSSPLAEGYGLTETSPVLTINPLDGRHKMGSIGLPIPNTEIKNFDDDFVEVAMGDPGELCAKGPQVMQGYYNKPKETDEVMKDGWFKTGDVAIMDEEGFFKIVDRKKEMILVSGFNVYPNEIENVISSHPKVLEVGVIGVPDPKSTEAVKAVVVKKDDTLSETEVIAYCKEKLTGYKCPRHVSFISELPKSNVGKILRRIIKENDLKTHTYEGVK